MYRWRGGKWHASSCSSAGQAPATTTIGEPVYLPPITAPAEVRHSHVVTACWLVGASGDRFLCRYRDDASRLRDQASDVRDIRVRTENRGPANVGANTTSTGFWLGVCMTWLGMSCRAANVDDSRPLPCRTHEMFS